VCETGRGVVDFCAMNTERRPRVGIVAGINGAGKTTASFEILRDQMKFPCFANADAIARGLNAFDVDAVAMSAGKVLLKWLDELAAERKDFSFETTMAGKTYARWLESLRATGYEVYLFYCWLDSPELAISRVAKRVAAGGHNVPDPTVRQRYFRSIANFFDLYRHQADYWEVYDNSIAGERTLIAIGSTDADVLVNDEARWEAFQRSAENA
jgi:predicted ABC-type ATPase